MRTSIHTLAGDGLLEQVEELLKHADEAKGPTVVLGDFNTLSKQKLVDTRSLTRVARLLDALLRPEYRLGERRSCECTLTGSSCATSRSFVGEWRVPLNVSDHWPVWAEVTLPDCRLPIADFFS